MTRRISAVALFLFVAGALVAQDEIRRGKIKAVDAEKKTITFTVDGKDETFTITANTKVFGTNGNIDKPFEDKSLAPGSAVMFKGGTQDGKAVLVGLKVG